MSRLGTGQFVRGLSAFPSPTCPDGGHWWTSSTGKPPDFPAVVDRHRLRGDRIDVCDRMTVARITEYDAACPCSIVLQCISIRMGINVSDASTTVSLIKPGVGSGRIANAC